MWQALLIMFVAMSMIPAGDLNGKLLTSDHAVAPAFVAWSRFALGTVMILPFVPRSAPGLLRDWRIWVRALCLTGGIFSIQTALVTEPLANVFAAFFVGPLVSYALSALFLKEPASLVRSLLMLTGFAGVLLVVRPGLGGSTGLLWAMAAGTFYGLFLTSSRWLSGLGSPMALSFTQLFISALVLLPLGLSNLPQTLTFPIAALTTGSAAFSMLGNLLLLFAYAKMPATKLAPLVYFQLIAAVGLGWAVFGDLPDSLTWAGLALIMTSGVISALLRR
ncbi:MAG: EamA family transporter [Rhodobacteraceae bacterium]|nr:EamA family transporter [Paracoccaceae bacterium]